MGELLPCPFCGDPAVTAIRHPTGSGYVVSCITSDCIDGPIGRTRQEAIAAWNRRTPSAVLPSEPTGALEVGDWCHDCGACVHLDNEDCCNICGGRNSEERVMPRPHLQEGK